MHSTRARAAFQSLKILARSKVSVTREVGRKANHGLFKPPPKRLPFDLRPRPTHRGPWEVGPSSAGALTFQFSDSSRLL